jgi:hypothetical protein
VYSAKNAVTEPNQETISESKALDHLHKKRFPYSPWLIGVHSWVNEQGTDERAIVGGYCWFIVMTKVPGKQLSILDLKKMSLSERDEVRKALKEAVM